MANPMTFRKNGLTITIYQKDIVKLDDVDAVVNAANGWLVHGCK